MNRAHAMIKPGSRHPSCDPGLQRRRTSGFWPGLRRSQGPCRPPRRFRRADGGSGTHWATPGRKAMLFFNCRGLTNFHLGQEWEAVWTGTCGDAHSASPPTPTRAAAPGSGRCEGEVPGKEGGPGRHARSPSGVYRGFTSGFSRAFRQ